MDIKLQFESKYRQIKSIKFHKNGNKKKEIYRDSTIAEFDEEGNIIHYKGASGHEYWREYDERANKIMKELFLREWWKEYDENGRLIYYKVNDKVILDKRKNKGE